MGKHLSWRLHGSQLKAFASMPYKEERENASNQILHLISCMLTEFFGTYTRMLGAVLRLVMEHLPTTKYLQSLAKMQQRIQGEGHCRSKGEKWATFCYGYPRINAQRLCVHGERTKQNPTNDAHHKDNVKSVKAKMKDWESLWSKQPALLSKKVITGFHDMIT